MQAEVERQSGGYPLYYTECSTYDYLPCGLVACVCTQCKQIVALRDGVQALQTTGAELEELKETEVHRQDFPGHSKAVPPTI